MEEPMTDPRVQEDRDYVASGYAERAVGAEQVFVPSSHMRVMATNERTEIIQETYRLLAIAVFSAMAAAWLACRYLPLVQFMASGPGWIVAMLGLNMVPRMALSAARDNKRNIALALAGYGAFAGACISPLIFVAMMLSGVGTEAPNLVQGALVITAVVFLGISGYVYQSGANFSFLKGICTGLFYSLLVAIPVNAYMLDGSGFGHLAILFGVGALGTMQLLWATSTVLRDPEYKTPAYGALALFAGLFNLFQVILSLMMRSRR